MDRADGRRLVGVDLDVCAFSATETTASVVSRQSKWECRSKQTRSKQVGATGSDEVSAHVRRQWMRHVIASGG